jgi:cell division protein FtsW
MTAVAIELHDAKRARVPALWPNMDQALLAALGALAMLGLIMVMSSSVSLAERQAGDAFYYFKRQLVFFGLGTGVAAVALRVRLESWQRASGLLLGLAYLLLILVLIPGIGREVNGAVRWIPLGLFNLQASEVVKPLLLLYLAAYLVRRGDAVRARLVAFLLPIGVMALASLLLLLEPDFGTAVVITATGLGMLFLAGVPLLWFGLLGGLVMAAGGLLIVTSPYRWARLTTFLDPWQDPFASGFQLTQSLIAIGRGEWFGVGLGGSVQKLFYLPEAHTDFLFAVLAEELGLLGVVGLIGLYGFVVARAFLIGSRSIKVGLPVAGYLAYGIGLWFGMQAFINIGVNMGLLPTKGLTLPLMSYGGSSLISTMLMMALLLRAGIELRLATVSVQPLPRGRA